MTEASERSVRRPRLWIVSELYYPELTSTGYYMTVLAEGLSQDFEVNVLCGQPNYSARGVRAPKTETYNGVKIRRCLGTTFDKNVIPLRIANMLSLSVATFIAALSGFRSGDQVLVVTTPPSLPFVVAAAARLRRASFTLLVHDNYPELLVALDKLKVTSLPVRVLNRANRLLFGRAKKVIGCGRDMTVLLENKVRGRNVPVCSIPNWAELETVEPREKSDSTVIRELKLQDKFVLLYAGNLGHPNDIESIVSCAELLKEDSRFHFVFIGSGVKRQWLNDQIRQQDLQNVSLLDPRPRSDQPDFLSACDVAFVSLVPKMNGVSVPSRTYNILAAGRPIVSIGEAGSEVSLVVEEEEVGWSVPPHQPHQLAALLKQIVAQGDELEAMGLRARAAAERKYSSAIAVSAYRQELLV